MAAADNRQKAQPRELNDHRRRLFERRGRPIVFVCECGRLDCMAAVLLTIEEYDACRPGLITADGHSDRRDSRWRQAVPPV
jgi:hypothetical protein